MKIRILGIRTFVDFNLVCFYCLLMTIKIAEQMICGGISRVYSGVYRANPF